MFEDAVRFLPMAIPNNSARNIKEEMRNAQAIVSEEHRLRDMVGGQYDSL